MRLLFLLICDVTWRVNIWYVFVNTQPKMSSQMNGLRWGWYIWDHASFHAIRALIQYKDVVKSQLDSVCVYCTFQELGTVGAVCKPKLKWFMMTSWNGKIFRVTGHLCGEFTGPGEIPAQRPVTRSFDVFLDLSLNKRLSKQSPGWWFETQSRPLWRQCNVLISSWSRLCPILWSQVLSREWRCSWSSADRRCSSYILVINNLLVY